MLNLPEFCRSHISRLYLPKALVCEVDGDMCEVSLCMSFSMTIGKDIEINGKLFRLEYRRDNLEIPG